jgi:protein tyrosine/serine phosphatase
VARARPGGVVVACGRGCDRTGLVALLLLALAGVGADDIAADWEQSVERLRPRQPEYPRELDEMLRRENTTVRACIARLMASVDIEGALRRGGLGDGDLSAARACLLNRSS